jgi:O-antigen ligase
MILFYFLVTTMPFLEPPVLHRLAGDATFRLVGALCGLYAGLQLSQRKVFPRYFATWQSRFMVLFYLIATASFLAKGITHNYWVTCTSYMVLFFVTLTVVDSLQRLRWVLNSAVAAIAWGSAWVLLEWIRYRHVLGVFRPGYSLGDPNYFASAAVLILPFVFLRMLSREQVRWEKWFYGGTLLVAAVALTLCASRGGFLGLMGGFLVAIWRSRHRARNLVIVGLLGLVPALALPNSPLLRLWRPSYSEETSNAYRVAAWQAGIQMVRAHPLVGVGLGNFKIVMPDYTEPGVMHQSIAHNSYVEVAAEMGIPQLMVFLAVLFSSLRSFSQVRRKVQQPGPRLLYDAAVGLQAGLLGHALAAIAFSAEYQKLFWLVLCLSMCLPALVRDMRLAEEKPSIRARGLPWRTGGWQPSLAPPWKTKPPILSPPDKVLNKNLG